MSNPLLRRSRYSHDDDDDANRSPRSLSSGKGASHLQIVEGASHLQIVVLRKVLLFGHRPPRIDGCAVVGGARWMLTRLLHNRPGRGVVDCAGRPRVAAS